ncbi:agmatine deiminase family protein [Oceaniserpentilla sp. 4NH20-0058]|uniref:agmatine deiminase family protein n=1 Tax=Oceaniserpentilla sp. 4NH20-0058 TaxID=3127660 RepID=UPI003109C01B
MNRYLPAEWHPQYAIQLTWPHAETDWHWILADIQVFYINLINTILEHEHVILSVQDLSLVETINRSLKQKKFKCHYYASQNNDTWTRDHGPIAVIENNKLVIKDFIFNGWGQKFDASLDNQITQNLFNQNAYPSDQLDKVNFILEGGSIESDGKGCLLTTRQCLLNTNRNSSLNQAQIEQLLSSQLGIKKVLWLNHGDLLGDDTDAHIDTLARFAPNNQIIFQGCNDKNDAHFDELQKMKAQLSELTNCPNEPFKLIELPWPDAQYDTESNDRLPATYANFLFINNAVLLPTYGTPQDPIAVQTMQQALPEYKIIPIDCSMVIRQFGSLHCLTMQIPAAVNP